MLPTDQLLFEKKNPYLEQMWYISKDKTPLFTLNMFVKWEYINVLIYKVTHTQHLLFEEKVMKQSNQTAISLCVCFVLLNI